MIPRPHARTGSAIALGIALTTAACGGGQTRLNLFSTDWEDDHGASIARIWSRIGSATIAPAADVVVGVAENGGTLIGLPLGTSDASPWTMSHALDARPIVTGNVVVAAGGGEVFALDAATGQTIWKRPTGGLPLVGAGDDGTVTVVTFKNAGGLGSVLLAVKHDGEVVRQIETGKTLGSPAVVAHLAFVPWAGQYVSVLDLSNGDEAARVTLRDETSHAWTEGGSLWFGERAVTRFDRRIASASAGNASTIKVPSTGLPGQPKLMLPGAETVPVAAGATDKVRLYVKPTDAGDAAGPDDGRFYATYFRVAMGLDAAGAKLEWVRVHPADFLGGAAVSGGLVLCDARGKVDVLDAKNGSTLSEESLGQPLGACVVNADGLRPIGTPDAKSLVSQLEEAVRIDDPMIVSAQRFLLQQIATVEDASATETLIDLASDPRTSPDLVATARKELAKRRNGASYMEAALQNHYDFLKGVTREPPVGPIAVALGAMNDKAAAPLLAAHLLDPSDTPDDVKQAAAALVLLGGPNELPALKRFFGMYRATADDEDVAAAVVSAGKAMLASHDPALRTQIQAAANDDATVEGVKSRLADAIAGKESDGGAK